MIICNNCNEELDDNLFYFRKDTQKYMKDCKK